MPITDYDPTDQGSGIFADLAAKLSLHIGAISDLTNQLQKPRKRRPPVQPVFGRVRASGLFPSSGVLTLIPDQPGPEQGYFWYVRSIVVGGLDPSVTAQGKAFVYVSAMLPTQSNTLAQLGLSDWRDQATTLPAVSFYGRGELPLRMNENLSIVVTGGTVAQQYVAAIQFEQYEEGPTGMNWDQ